MNAACQYRPVLIGALHTIIIPGGMMNAIAAGWTWGYVRLVPNLYSIPTRVQSSNSGSDIE